MATNRFYLSITDSSPVTPGFAAWDRTTEGLRAVMSLTKDGSTIGTKFGGNSQNFGGNATILVRQFMTLPMDAGQVFAVTDTIRCVIRCQESATNDNINRAPTCLKVYDRAGTTLQATLLSLLHRGPNTTEWIQTGLTNKQLCDGDVLEAGYTTVDGDRLVFEVGCQISGAGGSTVQANMSFGSSSATDCADDESGTAANNPWMDLVTATTLTFQAEAAAAVGYVVGGGVGGFVIGA